MKIDFHTHSTLSYDGGISEDEYSYILSSGILDQIAITDHNEIDFAIYMHNKYGNKYIVGEEVMSDQGEIIGLFLNKKIKPQLSPKQTVDLIHDQGGIVLIPHPFDIYRHGLGHQELLSILEDIDVIEGFNSRSILSGNKDAYKFAQKYNLPIVANSDAHSYKACGYTYNIFDKVSSVHSVLEQSHSSDCVKQKANLMCFLSPTINKVKKLLHS